MSAPHGHGFGLQPGGGGGLGPQRVGTWVGRPIVTPKTRKMLATSRTSPAHTLVASLTSAAAISVVSMISALRELVNNEFEQCGRWGRLA